MSLIQNPVADQQMHVIVVGDGKNVTPQDNQRVVKISEKREGKGKGKTIAYLTIPTLSYPLGEDAELSLRPMVLELLSDLQNEICVSLARTGATHILEDQISVPACVGFWSQKSFNAETVGNWFDGEMKELLAGMIVAAKGWDTQDDLTVEQAKFLEQKCNAYRGTYVEVASKFPKLNPTQLQELLRVLDAAEMNGPIVDRIRDKITPKNVESELGF